jgi:phosphatidylglycerol:prolipoprotein diacylglycerol transferase
MIDWTPTAIALQIGPIPLYWYGIAYAAGLFVAYLVVTRMAERYHQNTEYVGNGMIVIGVAALIGGRLYHVIDQFNACGPGGPCYSQDLLKIVLPPYTGLGVYGGIVTGMLAFFYLQRRWKLDLWTWADIMAPGIFVMQGLGRWGNFFNQELYGPPTTLPWGIAIDCAHRVAPYTCDVVPATAHFTPLFLYESLSGLVGAAFLFWLASKPRPRLRRGDLLPILFIWYAIIRFLLESLRTGNWHLEGIATAQLFSVAFIAVSVAVLVYRHRTAPPEDMVGVPPTSGSMVAEGPPAAADGGGASGAASPDPEPLT